jgi:hypothetical protein
MTEQNGFWPDGARLAFAPGHLGELTQYLPFELRGPGSGQSRYDGSGAL